MDLNRILFNVKMEETNKLRVVYIYIIFLENYVVFKLILIIIIIIREKLINIYDNYCTRVKNNKKKLLGNYDNCVIWNWILYNITYSNS